MKTFLAKIFVVIVLSFLVQVGSAYAGEKQSLEFVPGAGTFSMKELTGVNDSPLRVFYYRPTTWQQGKPIVMVFHGLGRNAEEYRDSWKQYAAEYGLLVICPEFSEKKYPGVRYYNLGNMADKDDETGTILPQKAWIFPTINHVVDYLKKNKETKESKIAIFGHSAGAQMVHRYVLFGGKSKAASIIVANAGWYTMPNADANFPYGTGKLSYNKEELTEALAKPVTVLLGDQDTKRSKILRKTPQADAQGRNRLERGQNFYKAAQAMAKKQGVPFNWSLVLVPGVGHDNAGMAGTAAKLIAEKLK